MNTNSVGRSPRALPARRPSSCSRLAMSRRSQRDPSARRHSAVATNCRASGSDAAGINRRSKEWSRREPSDIDGKTADRASGSERVKRPTMPKIRAFLLYNKFPTSQKKRARSNPQKCEPHIQFTHRSSLLSAIPSRWTSPEHSPLARSCPEGRSQKHASWSRTNTRCFATESSL